MKVIQNAFAALILSAIAMNITGCTTQGKRISEPSGAAIYRDGEWQPVDESNFHHVRSKPGPAILP